MKQYMLQFGDLELFGKMACQLSTKFNVLANHYKGFICKDMMCLYSTCLAL